MKIPSVLFCLICAVCSVAAQSQKELVTKAAQGLETAPLAAETIKMRDKALAWLNETDEVSAKSCSGVFAMFGASNKNMHAVDMTASYTIGIAAFKLEHPDKASDENASQLAGLELALKTYEALVKVRPKTKYESAEVLLLARRDGVLASLVDSENCGKK